MAVERAWQVEEKTAWVVGAVGNEGMGTGSSGSAAWRRSTSLAVRLASSSCKLFALLVVLPMAYIMAQRHLFQAVSGCLRTTQH